MEQNVDLSWNVDNDTGYVILNINFDKIITSSTDVTEGVVFVNRNVDNFKKIAIRNFEISSTLTEGGATQSNILTNSFIKTIRNYTMDVEEIPYIQTGGEQYSQEYIDIKMQELKKEVVITKDRDTVFGINAQATIRDEVTGDFVNDVFLYIYWQGKDITYRIGSRRTLEPQDAPRSIKVTIKLQGLN